MTSPTTNEQFWQQGYELLPPCLSQDEIRSASIAIDDWMKHVAAPDFSFIQDILSEPRFVQMSRQSTVVDRISQLLGHEPEVYYSHFIVSKPVPHKPFLIDGWHKDHEPSCVKGVKAAFYLTDTSQMGCGNTYIKPGSHDTSQNPDTQAVPVLTKAGGVLLYRPPIWHSRSTNRSPWPRKVLFMSYR